MSSEISRFSSLVPWKYHILDKKELVINGFYADKEGLLHCCFCGMTIENWTSWVNETELHRIKSPRCKLFVKDDTELISTLYGKFFQYL